MMSITQQEKEAEAIDSNVEGVSEDVSPHTDDHQTQKPSPNTEDEAKLGGPRFSPPLYRQRYLFCAEVLAKHGIKSVADFGCAECQIMLYLKQVGSLERISLVDIDRVSLELNKHKAEPLITDHLDPRDNPLTVEMYQGSVTQMDARLADIQAVTMVELIEHLPEPELTAFPVTIFGRINPQLVIITTPNADFNQLFPDLTGFRHWDHKFEWTKQEFQNWCTEQAVKYGYEVEFSGVGLGPPGTEPLGYCSQAAIFVSRSSSSSSETLSSSPASPSSSQCEDSMKYTLVFSSIHPHKTHKFTVEEKKLMEINYCLNHLSRNPDYSDTCDTAVIPINDLHRYVKVKEFFGAQEDLVDFLSGHGYTLTPDSASVLYHLEEKEFGEGLEWGYQPADFADSCGQFSDAEDDPSPWNPPESEELWE